MRQGKNQEAASDLRREERPSELVKIDQIAHTDSVVQRISAQIYWLDENHQ